MPCVNHPEREVQSYCQNCGKALCTECVRSTASGQIVCEPCLATMNANPMGANPAQPYWPPYVVPTPPGTPNPSAAAVLGFIPGVGAMYNGQFFKGFIHVVVFAVLISVTERYGVFGIFIGAWVLYQSFEAYHTAKARRDGQPLPDPFGLNELGSWLNLGGSRGPIHPGSGIPPADPSAGPGAGSPGAGVSGTGYAPGTGYTPGPAYVPGATPPPPYSAPYSADWQSYTPPPPQPPYSEPYVGEYPPPGVPPPPFGWRRKEPIWAFILIGLGILFLLQSLGVVSNIFHFTWPLILIGVGVWLIISRTRGGTK